mgnify:CR=1 FL=1
MQKLAFYGKGGIGKSTIAAGVSMALARDGKRVLHVGCDPKHDSTLALVPDGKITTVIDQIFSKKTGELRREHLIMKGKHGIECVESGGPEAGVGCGGRAVSRMLEIFEEIGVVDESLYDVVVFDVLGDVVCGGFAAPLRSAFAPKVVIVLSEELAATYAANNIAKGVKHYLDNDVCLAGLVLNLRDNSADITPIQKFADQIKTCILATIPRDKLVQQAELEGESILQHAPDSQTAGIICELSRKLIALDPATCLDPEPLELMDLRQLMHGKG